MSDRPSIQIEYCNQCGFLLRAGWMAQELLRAFEDELAEVALRPSGGGNFVVRLSGDILFSRKETGHFPEIKELKQLIRDRIDSDRLFGHDERDTG